MNSNKIVPEVNKIDKTTWNGYLNLFKDANIYQTWPYGSYAKGGNNLSHIVLRQEGNIAGLAQVRIMKTPILNRGIAYLYRGPLWRLKNEESSEDKLLNILQALKNEYAGKQKLLLRVVPNEILSEDKSIESVFINAGFSGNLNIKGDRTFFLDLNPPIDQLKKNLNSSWRRNLNKAGRNDLEITEDAGIKSFDTFLKLYDEMLDRKGFRQYVNPELFRKIQQELPPELKMIVIIAYKDNIPVSGAIGTLIGEKAIYLFGATSNQGTSTNASFLVHWRLLSWFKDHNCKIYDLGGINPELNPGVYRFKSGMGGKDVRHLPAYEACEDIISKSVVKLGERIRK